MIHLLLAGAIAGLTSAVVFGNPPPEDETSPISCSVIVSAPVKDVWAAYTTTAGVTAWMAPKATVDMRVGGKFRTAYDKNSSLDGPDVIENTILSFDPERMYSIQCTKTPDSFPFKRTMAHIWTVVYFRPVNPGKTEVECRMIGWDGSDESNQVRAFFAKNNRVELDELVKYFTRRKA